MSLFARRGPRRRRPVPWLLVAVAALLVALPLVAAHPAPAPTAGFARIQHDCNDDQAGGDAFGGNGHDLIALDVLEKQVPGQGWLLVLRLYLNGGFATDDLTGGPALNAADYLYDEIRFTGPDGGAAVWLRADMADSGSFPTVAHHQQFSAVAGRGTVQPAWISEPVNFNKDNDAQQGPDGDRAYIDFGLNLTDLGVTRGDALTGFEVESHWVDGNNEGNLDWMPGGPDGGACPAGTADALYDPDGYAYTVVGLPNTGPVAAFTIASPGGAHKANQTITFTDGSSDDYGIAARAWTFGDGATSTATNPTHAYGAPGTYTVGLTVTDTDGVAATASQTITVGESINRAPVAAFTATADGLTVAVDATGSTDADGDALTFAWNFGDGGAATGATATHTYAADGAFAITLTVTDPDGATDTSRQSLTLAAGATPPSLSLAVDHATAVVGQTVTFTATVTDDGTATVAWDFDDGATGVGESIAHAFAALGNYTVTATATDDDGLSAQAEIVVAITAGASGDGDASGGSDSGNGGGGTDDDGADNPPVAGFTYSPAPPIAGEPVLFTDAAIDEGTIAAWRWDFGDGDRSTAASPVHTFDRAGSYRVRLTVTDGDGNIDTAEQTLRVESADFDAVPSDEAARDDKGSPGIGVAALVIAVVGALLVGVRRR